jgi:hypothetical protein
LNKELFANKTMKGTTTLIKMRRFLTREISAGDWADEVAKAVGITQSELEATAERRKKRKVKTRLNRGSRNLQEAQDIGASKKNTTTALEAAGIGVIANRVEGAIANLRVSEGKGRKRRRKKRAKAVKNKKKAKAVKNKIKPKGLKDKFRQLQNLQVDVDDFDDNGPRRTDERNIDLDLGDLITPPTPRPATPPPPPGPDPEDVLRANEELNEVVGGSGAQEELQRQIEYLKALGLPESEIAALVQSINPNDKVVDASLSTVEKLLQLAGYKASGLKKIGKPLIDMILNRWRRGLSVSGLRQSLADRIATERRPIRRDGGGGGGGGPPDDGGGGGGDGGDPPDDDDDGEGDDDEAPVIRGTGAPDTLKAFWDRVIRYGVTPVSMIVAKVIKEIYFKNDSNMSRSDILKEIYNILKAELTGDVSHLNKGNTTKQTQLRKALTDMMKKVDFVRSIYKDATEGYKMLAAVNLLDTIESRAARSLFTGKMRNIDIKKKVVKRIAENLFGQKGLYKNELMKQLSMKYLNKAYDLTAKRYRKFRDNLRQDALREKALGQKARAEKQRGSKALVLSGSKRMKPEVMQQSVAPPPVSRDTRFTVKNVSADNILGANQSEPLGLSNATPAEGREQRSSRRIPDNIVRQLTEGQTEFTRDRQTPASIPEAEGEVIFGEPTGTNAIPEMEPPAYPHAEPTKALVPAKKKAEPTQGRHLSHNEEGADRTNAIRSVADLRPSFIVSDADTINHMASNQYVQEENQLKIRFEDEVLKSIPGDIYTNPLKRHNFMESRLTFAEETYKIPKWQQSRVPRKSQNILTAMNIPLERVDSTPRGFMPAFSTPPVNSVDGMIPFNA